MLEEKNSNEPHKNVFLVRAVVDSDCSMHKTKRLEYLQWHDWAEKKLKRGAKQKQCLKCERWYFRDEF